MLGIGLEQRHSNFVPIGVLFFRLAFFLIIAGGSAVSAIAIPSYDSLIRTPLGALCGFSPLAELGTPAIFTLV